MSNHPLESSFAKLERARLHIRDVDSAIKLFFDKRPYRLAPEVDASGAEEVWSFVLDAIPLEIECAIADAVHNIRTPLDRMLSAGFRYDKIHTESAKPGALKFPVGNHANEMPSLLKYLSDHFTVDVIDFLREIEPYRGGAGDIIWVINTLDNRDKHRSLAEPIKMSFTDLAFQELVITGALLLRWGSRKGQHLVRAPEALPKPGKNVMHQPVDELRPRVIGNSVADRRFLFSSPHDDMEFITTTPGAGIYSNFEPTFNIGLHDMARFSGVPVVSALTELYDSVETILMRFEERFF
ncbi:MAG: hypothetical protein PGN12_16550 [Sphingomonas phyllosphaerae]